MSTTAVVAISSKLPARKTKVVDEAMGFLSSLKGVSFPFMSIRGKEFTVVRGKENRTTITRPDDPDTPASSIEVVIVSFNKHKSKTFYHGSFEEGNAAKPDCFSNDAIKPDPSSPDVQCKTCAACPHNVFGTGANGKGKKCQDNVRMAIAAPDNIDDVMLLRVPPASFGNLAALSNGLSEAGYKFDEVKVRLSFEKGEATPKLKFYAFAPLTEEETTAIREVAATELVGQIIGTVAIPRDDDDGETFDKPLPKKDKPAKKAEADEGDDEPEEKPALKKTKKVEAADEDDDPEEKPAPKKTKKPVAETSDDDDGLDAELEDLIGSQDD